MFTYFLQISIILFYLGAFIFTYLLSHELREGGTERQRERESVRERGRERGGEREGEEERGREREREREGERIAEKGCKKIRSVTLAFPTATSTQLNAYLSKLIVLLLETAYRHLDHAVRTTPLAVVWMKQNEIYFEMTPLSFLTKTSRTSILGYYSRPASL